METSRKDGILILRTKVPYQMAVSGSISDVSEIICKEITYPVEGIAFDIEQIFYNAMINVAGKSKDFKSEGGKSNDDTGYDIKECPTDEEIEDNANQLEVLFKMNSAGKMSELVNLFEGIINAGLVMAEGMIPMSAKLPPWTTISRQDKSKIIFKYISFFVKPLVALNEALPTKQEK